MANISELVAKYIAIRDKKAEIVADQKGVLDRINHALSRIEASMLEAMQGLGVESMRTPSGTAYQSTRTSAKVEDREAFLTFVRENEAWAFLESRANKTAVEEFLTEHQELPPGITITKKLTVGIRRS